MRARRPAQGSSWYGWLLWDDPICTCLYRNYENKRRTAIEVVLTSHFRLGFCLGKDLFISPLTEYLIVVLLTTRLVGFRLLTRDLVQLKKVVR